MKKNFFIDINGEKVDLIIIKKKKKNISLQVKPNLEIVLNIPMRISYDLALKIIEEKKEWIEKKFLKYKDLKKDNKIYYLGKPYTESEIFNLISVENDSVSNFSLEEWYYYKLRILLEEKVEKFSEIMKLYPKKIRIKPLKSAWGICYSNGNITFNLHLIKAPLEIIDYIVIHEIGHLKHPNHSKEYWEYLENYIESPKKYRAWLRKNGYLFT